MELDMLQTFARHPNEVLSRDRLLEVAHKAWAPFDRSIDIRVGRLRQKVEPDPHHPATIKTVRGIGYIFVSA
jgi:DNA-binding response OmpR family regulator